MILVTYGPLPAKTETFARKNPSHCVNVCVVVSIAASRIDYIDSKNKSTQILIIDGVRFYRNRLRGSKQYWKCSQYYKPCRCPAIAICNLNSLSVQRMYKHNHGESSVAAGGD